MPSPLPPLTNERRRLLFFVNILEELKIGFCKICRILSLKPAYMKHVLFLNEFLINKNRNQCNNPNLNGLK